MKKLLVIFLCFLILSSSGGLVMAKHFCEGKLVEAALFMELHSCCDGMEMPSGCCEMEHELIKHDDNIQITILNVDHPEQFLIQKIEYPSTVQAIVHSTFIYNTFQLRPLTVSDRLARNQSFLL